MLKGIEVDILDDGSLDLPAEALRDLDVVVAAVHSRFNLSRDAQTRRILAALANPLVNILAHPVGRLIDSRDPYDVDMPQIIGTARLAGSGGRVEYTLGGGDQAPVPPGERHMKLRRDAVTFVVQTLPP